MSMFLDDRCFPKRSLLGGGKLCQKPPRKQDKRIGLWLVVILSNASEFELILLPLLSILNTRLMARDYRLIGS